MKHLLLITTLVCTATAPLSYAQNKIELQPDDTMRSVLEKHVGQTVDLRLKSGDKIGGKLEKVTDKLVHLAQLTGAEYSDGVVDLTHVSAVVARTKAAK